MAEDAARKLRADEHVISETDTEQCDFYISREIEGEDWFDENISQPV